MENFSGDSGSLNEIVQSTPLYLNKIEFSLSKIALTRNDGISLNLFNIYYPLFR